MDSSQYPNPSQVWERVLQAPSQPSGDLRPLMRSAMELAGIYKTLLGQFPRQEKLRTLYDGEKANLAALKGLALIQNQSAEVLNLWSPAKKPPQKLLAYAYHQTRRCMADYLSRSAEPEYGHVFRELADREGRHCLWLAEALGML